MSNLWDLIYSQDEESHEDGDAESKNDDVNIDNFDYNLPVNTSVMSSAKRKRKIRNIFKCLPLSKSRLMTYENSPEVRP